ncbi:saccharopine dehydrogenase NADP-binding domain-containing protein [candidate division KSB1 bacterium]|nr:saccharopine dehydrogenase NADP-binding domain-containing protein [candidate division KSB1 bacterium]
MKKVLVLGAGLVAKPLVRYLLDQGDIFVVVASRTVSKAEALVDGHSNGRALPLNVKNIDELDKLVQEADIAISLLPYTYHVQVAEFCLKHQTHLITTSYVSPAMKALDAQAREKKLLFLNEIGLDPGIDHMSAMKIIHQVQNQGGKIISFESCCGGLPAPEANDNPLGYKFSWSPRGVVMAGRNAAHFRKDNRDIQIEGKDLFRNHWPKEVESLGMLEVYPNRDSMLYEELYGLQGVETLFRGTFRNPGWCETLLNIVNLGFLDDTEKPELVGKSLAEVTALLVGVPANADLKAKTAAKLGLETNSEVIARMEWLGLFSDEPADTDPATLLDVLASRMLKKMPYQKGERDMIVLQHDFIAAYPDGKRKKICSLLIDYGIPNGDSSMARTVSLPAAIAAKLMLNGKIRMSGVHIPVVPEIYEPVLAELETMNITFKETESTL